jgi:hypothetical protein
MFEPTVASIATRSRWLSGVLMGCRITVMHFPLRPESA